MSSRSSSKLVSPPIVFRPVNVFLAGRGSSSDELPSDGTIIEGRVGLLINDIRLLSGGGFSFGLLKGSTISLAELSYLLSQQC